MRVWLGMIVLFAAAGCTHFWPGESVGDGQAKPAYERITFAGEKATAVERARCETAGGEVRRDGLAGWEQCIQTLSDGGQSCTDSDECLGRCELTGGFVDYETPATGTCQASDSLFGCFQTVEDGRADPAICVD